jgi:hypothetical protein
VNSVGCVDGVLPLGADLGCGAVVHRSRGVQPDPGVTALGFEWLAGLGVGKAIVLADHRCAFPRPAGR